jgi:peptidyl-prolyl cis-trans isomerase B (cyclophilin B)
MKRIANYFLNSSIVLSLLFISACSYAADNGEKKPTTVEMKTSKGNITILLYDKTPLHKENFIKLVNSGFYEGIMFHRVINSFMAQAGDPNSRNPEFNGTLGQNSEGETIPSEIVPEYFHKKGALAAARMGDQVNPDKKSSGSQFYIVQGKKHNRGQLTQMEAKINQQKENALIGIFLKKSENAHYMETIRYCQQQKLNDSLNSLYQEIKSLVISQDSNPFSFSEEAIQTYETIGGTPFLDNGYTVFGEVTNGLDIIDQICSVATLKGDKPVDPITIISVSIKK